MTNLRIDPERLWGELMETAAIGSTTKGGICRLTLTDLDRQVRDWFKARAEKLGCTVAVDDMGVMYARRGGQRDMPPIAMGSHLDTQPTGGKFDGVLGVLGALEALRTMVEAGYETYAPIEVINWTNEEGSRFTPAMLASGTFAGVFTRDWAATRRDRAGVGEADRLAVLDHVREDHHLGDARLLIDIRHVHFEFAEARGEIAQVAARELLARKADHAVLPERAGDSVDLGLGHRRREVEAFDGGAQSCAGGNDVHCLLRSANILSYVSTACSSTCAPMAHCSCEVNSASLWLMPSRHGTKIMAVGATLAT